MKKFVSLVCGFIAVGILGVFIVKQSNYDRVFEANLEALSQMEIGYTVTCFSSSYVNPGHDYYDCGGCKKTLDRSGEGTEKDCVTFSY